MKKIELIGTFQKWLKKNTDKKIDTLSMIESAELVDVDEIYQDEQVGVNETFYTISLPSNLSLTGIQQKFMYQSTDLIFFDDDGDICAAKTINYKVLTNY